ncbi:MFS transporter [Zavarzinia sp. CC-PAN008]|uniref:MFS transporter n=1 Tax=Zavarzinia sp. CC-PAN008 TaxID=3243332 RepID=UPI003F7450CA
MPPGLAFRGSLRRRRPPIPTFPREGGRAVGCASSCFTSRPARMGTGDVVVVAPLRARVGWIMFDWAFQPFFTVITAFIFAPYFANHVVGDPVAGQALWGYGQGIAGAAIALMAPPLGAIADAAGPRKPWILALALLTFAGSASLWWAEPGLGAGAAAWVVVACIVLATIGAEYSVVFNNAMLPSLVPPQRIGQLSAIGWGMGYLGGLASLGIMLAFFALPQVPALGLDKASHEPDRFAGPFTALWVIVFLVPLFLWTPDAPHSGLSRGGAVRAGLAELRQTLSSLRQYRNVLRYLVAHMLYIDGLSAVFAFGGIYASSLFGWNAMALGIFGIALIVVSTLGVFLGAVADRVLGSKRTVTLSVVLILLATAGIVSITADSVLFLVDVMPQAPGSEPGNPFDSTAEQVFFVFAGLLGLGGGPAQASSRTLLARLAPPDRLGQFFGLYALSGKATAFLAPFAVAAATDLLDSQRGGIAIILVFLLGGLVLLQGVRAPR